MCGLTNEPSAVQTLIPEGDSDKRSASFPRAVSAGLAEENKAGPERLRSFSNVGVNTDLGAEHQRNM